MPSNAALSQVQEGGLKFHPSKKSGTGICLLQGRTITKVRGEFFPYIFVCSGQQKWGPSRTQLAYNQALQAHIWQQPSSSSTKLAATKLFNKCHYTDFTDG